MCPRRRPDSSSRLSSETGTTVIEISMVTGLLGLVLTILIAVLWNAQGDLEREISRSTSNDQVRLAAQSMDREIRSGDVVYDPTGEVYAPGDIASGMSIRVYSQTNLPTRGEKKCVQWRITSAGELQRRSWATNWQSSPSTKVSAWRIVATGLRNRADNVAAFVRPTPNLVNITLRANGDPSGRKGSTVEVRLSVTGRNTIFNTANDVCGPATPDPALSSNGYQVPPY